MRIAIVNKDKCSPEKCSYECIRFCPGVRMKDETIIKDEKGYPIISEDLCTGCGICVRKCPFKAITIINLPEEPQNKLHQYGVNSFRIYNLPTPQNGVVGLVGKNGIGKSTILKILAGHLVPNLGDYGKKPSWEKIIEHFKGHETQKYLIKLSNEEINVSYKLQEIQKIPDIFDGTVKEMIEETTKKNTSELIKDFELEKCRNTHVSDVSGGELQRAAIATALGKDADFYFFDEPSSFLDIYQRLRVAKKIRELGNKKSVMVVEHDMAVLDYLTDYVYILYGHAGAFGIVSALKNSRVGINEFLDGFLKNENVRIRDYSIKFELKPPSTSQQSQKGYAYNNFTKHYPAFKLEVEDANIPKGETISILGPNAIGKSTYMKILAGEEKPTSGNPGLKVKISYKPQYINIKSSETVLNTIMKSDIDKAVFNSELKSEVEDLFDNKIDELSGGQLQKIAISLALSKDCDICLLDEPSAFLDIEQRLKFAHIIKRIASKKDMATLVVDHDIVFQDLVGNSAMIFEGIPGSKGKANKPTTMHDGMNTFLKDMGITFRRDPDSHRPRANKPNSQKDEEQKKNGEYYYLLE